MNEANFDVVLANNLKALGADFKSLKLPTDPSALGNAFRNYPKLLLAQLFGFLLRKFDEKKFDRLIKPLLACYNRAVDNQLKNIFHMWIKELPIVSWHRVTYEIYQNLGLSTSFSRVWSVPCPRTYCKFFAVLSTQIIETCIERGDFGPDVGILDDVDDYVHEYLENVSKIHSRFSATERLGFVDKSFLPENQSDILKSCLEYAELKISASQDLTIQELTAFQLKRFNESQDLKRRVFSLYSEWLSMKPLYSDFASVCVNPPKITATDFKDSVVSLSELLKMSGEIFTSVQKLLFRYNGAESEISSDLLWCCNSINRLIESEKFADLKKIDVSTQAISSKLDIIINKLNEVIAESADTLSVSRSGSSGRVLRDSKGRHSAGNYSTNSSLLLKSPFSPVFQSSNQIVKKTSEEVNLDVQISPTKSFSNEAIGTAVFEVKDEVHLTDPDNQSKENTSGSILKSPRAFEIYHCNDPINDPEAEFNCDEMPAKSILKLSSFSFSPENSNFTDDDALFNDINNELASLLHTTTLRDRRTGDEEEDTEENLKADAEEFKIPLQPEVPPITPLLMPSRLSNPRASLKSLRFGTPISSERKIEKDEEYVDENENEPIESLSTTPYLKSFSEFSCDNVDIATAKPLRLPFTLVTSNFENNPRLSELPTFAGLCAKSVNTNSNSTNQTDEIAKRGSAAGEEDDESLGLLSFGDMDNPDSEFLMMSQ